MIGAPVQRELDLCGVGGRRLLTHLLETDPWFRSAFGQRIESIMVLVATFDHEINELTSSISHVFGDHAGYHAIQAIDGVGPITAAIFTAEIGDVTRFTSAGHLASWCGLTPRHYESDSTLRRGPITKQGSKLVRWAAIESAQKLRRDSVLHNVVNASPSDATTGASPRSRSLDGSSRSSTTGSATGTSAAWNPPREHTRTRAGCERVVCHDPHLGGEIVSLIAPT